MNPEPSDEEQWRLRWYACYFQLSRAIRARDTHHAALAFRWHMTGRPLP